MSKRRAEEEVDGPFGLAEDHRQGEQGPAPSRDDYMAAASARVRELAVTSQQEALVMMQQATDLDQLLAWGLSADAGSVSCAASMLIENCAWAGMCDGGLMRCVRVRSGFGVCRHVERVSCFSSIRTSSSLPTSDVGLLWRIQATGPGAQSFIVVLHVLKMLLGARIESVRSGADLLSLLQQWQSSWVPVGVVEQIESFIETRAQDFCEGDHLGGKKFSKSDLTTLNYLKK